jgi:hypothetical protein
VRHTDADIICTASRALVYNDDSATSVASGSTGERDLQSRLAEVDSMRIQKRIDASPAFGAFGRVLQAPTVLTGFAGNAAWYM